MDQLPLRWRLTIFVTAVFAGAMAALSFVVVDVVENDLVDDTRASAETVLIGYLDSIYGGVAAFGVVDDGLGTEFFYRDGAGNEIDEFAYFTSFSTALDAEFQAMLEADGVLLGDVLAEEASFDSGVVLRGPVEGIVVDPESGAIFDDAGDAVTFMAGPIPDGDPRPVERGEDVVAVAQTLAFADGTTLEVGVSSPLQPVTDSIDTITSLFLIGVPFLTLAIAGATWLAATRALRPVHAIATEARAITANQLDQRLPLPGANDEVRELTSTVNDMLGRIERGQQQQRRLVADASHELRSPVAASRAQLEVARRHPEGADWDVVADVVLAEQEQLSRLIDDLLALSRLEEAGLPARRDVDLDELVHAEAQRHHRVPVGVVDLPPARVRGDQGLLERAVRNLVDNAAQHALERVELHLEQRADTTTLHVDDDGPGVDLADRVRIFERFSRVDQARDRESGGAGLGLAIVQAVASAHGGSVRCSQSPLGGARFTVSIPRSPAQ